jgi:hypothetical protein
MNKGFSTTIAEAIWSFGSMDERDLLKVGRIELENSYIVFCC